MRSKSLLGAALFALACTGCKGCREEKPYTPFGVASGVAPEPAVDASDAGDAAAPRDAERAFTPKRDVAAPPSTRRWQIGSHTLVAPEGRRFDRALFADLNGDEREDAVAWTVPVEHDRLASAGELWFYPSGGAPTRVATLPGFVPTGPECTLETRLAETGPKTVTLDAVARCAARLVPRSPVRGVVVLVPASESPVLLSLRLAEPAPEEQLELSVDSTDQDGDGHDDVRIDVSMKLGETSKTASAPLVWFERAAGISRDPREPVRSLSREASRILTRARGRKTSQSTPEEVGLIRRLVGSLCAESGAPRIFDEDGAPLRCGDLAATLARLSEAELASAITRGDHLEAFAVLARDGWHGPRLSDKVRSALVKELLGKVTEANVQPIMLSRQPLPRRTMPRYSPLTFDGQGTLYVQTTDGLRRWNDDDALEPVGTDAGVASWPLDVTAPDGRGFIGVIHACDRSEVLLGFANSAGIPTDAVPTALLAPRPGPCNGKQPADGAPPAALGFEGGALSAIVAGSLVGKLPGGPPKMLGTPRSPDGKWLVTVTPLGLFVTGERHELWRLADVSPADLGDCAVSNGALRVACVHRNGGLVAARRPN